MHRSLLLSLVLVMIVVPPAAAQDGCDPSMLFLVVDGNDCMCRGEVLPGSPLTARVILYAGHHPRGIAHIELKLYSLEFPTEEQGRITEVWYADTVAGDLETGVVLSWSEGLEPTTPYVELGVGGVGEGNFFELGMLVFQSFDPAWPGEDPGFTIGSPDPDFWHISAADVHDIDFEVVPAAFMLDSEGSSQGCLQVCWGGAGWWRDIRYPLPVPGSEVSGTFDFEFDTVSIRCPDFYDLPYTGHVLLNDEVIHEFEGFRYTQHALPVSTAGFADGEVIHLRVVVGSWEQELAVDYVVDTTPVKPTSFSAVKSMY
ncbi:MAG: hypothetical protein JW819_11595 [Candidatus Krumholzibacteriota bacterium]|nr:hypothetical protein [Candidatus Krumholzibacteriota bacterium]